MLYCWMTHRGGATPLMRDALLLSGLLPRNGCNGRTAAAPPPSEREEFMCDLGRVIWSE